MFLTRICLICLYVCEEVRLGCSCVLAARKQNPISKNVCPHESEIVSSSVVFAFVK